MSIQSVASNPDVMELAESTPLTQNQSRITACFWYKATTLTATQQIFYLIENGGSNSRFEFQFTSAGLLQTFVRAPDSGGADNIISSSGISTDSLVGPNRFISIVIDLVAKTIRYLIDGVFVSQHTLTVVTNTAFDNTVLGVNNGFMGNVGGSQPANGQIADLQFYHRALSDAEIKTLYHTRNRVALSNLVAWYRCNERASGSTVAATDLIDASKPKYLGSLFGIDSGTPTYRKNYMIPSIEG